MGAMDMADRCQAVIDIEDELCIDTIEVLRDVIQCLGLCYYIDDDKKLHQVVASIHYLDNESDYVVMLKGTDGKYQAKISIFDAYCSLFQTAQEAATTLNIMRGNKNVN